MQDKDQEKDDLQPKGENDLVGVKPSYERYNGMTIPTSTGGFVEFMGGYPKQEEKEEDQ